MAAEALRGIEMMEKMEAGIAERKGREANMVSKMREAFKVSKAQSDWESQVEAIEKDWRKIFLRIIMSEPSDPPPTPDAEPVPE